MTASNAGGVSGASNSLAVTPSATAPVVLVGVVSRKLHGAAGAFEIPIDQSAAIAGNVTVEPRVIGAGHTLVFQFNSPITNAGSVTMTDSASNAVGSASTALGAFGEVVVTATGVADNKRVTITLGNINGIAALNASVSVGFLVGDVNNTRSVNASDISGIKSRSGLATDASNFRFDINASGAINASDISTVKARSGLTLIP